MVSADKTPAEAAGAELQGIKEDSKQMWGEIHYIKADQDLLRERLDTLHGRLEDLLPMLVQCAATADVQRLSEDCLRLASALDALSTRVTELDALKAAGPDERPQPAEWADALRDRLDALTPRVAELDQLKATLYHLAGRMEQMPQPAAEMAGLAPRVKTLESFQEGMTKVLEKYAGPGPLETQLESLLSWIERAQAPADGASTPGPPAGWRELRDDIKLIKCLLSDFIKRAPGPAEG